MGVPLQQRIEVRYLAYDVLIARTSGLPPPEREDVFTQDGRSYVVVSKKWFTGDATMFVDVELREVRV